MKLLLVEDDPEICGMLKKFLEKENFEIITANDGEEACSKFRQETCDLVLLDLMLPKISGMDVLQQIRAQSTVPIIIMSAKDTDSDITLGLGLGADDYVTKPFSMPILLEKIRAVLRRSAGAEPDNRLRYRDLAIDPDTREAVLDGRVLDLTTREFDLLYTFLHAPGRVFTREMLLARLWGYDFYGDERVVDSHIKNLRHKLGRNYIETVRGVGYRAAKPDP